MCRHHVAFKLTRLQKFQFFEFEFEPEMEMKKKMGNVNGEIAEANDRPASEELIGKIKVQQRGREEAVGREGKGVRGHSVRSIHASIQTRVVNGLSVCMLILSIKVINNMELNLLRLFRSYTQFVGGFFLAVFLLLFSHIQERERQRDLALTKLS